MKAEIVSILYKEQIKFIKEENKWPEGFLEKPTDGGGDDDSDLFVNSNRVQVRYRVFIWRYIYSISVFSTRDHSSTFYSIGYINGTILLSKGFKEYQLNFNMNFLRFPMKNLKMKVRRRKKKKKKM